MASLSSQIFNNIIANGHRLNDQQLTDALDLMGKIVKLENERIASRPPTAQQIRVAKMRRARGMEYNPNHIK